MSMVVNAIKRSKKMAEPVPPPPLTATIQTPQVKSAVETAAAEWAVMKEELKSVRADYSQIGRAHV